MEHAQARRPERPFVDRFGTQDDAVAEVAMTAARRKNAAATVAREHGAERVTLTPVTVSQHTAPTALGVTERQFLDTLRKYRVPHAKVGKIRLVRVVVWLRFVETHEETVVDEATRTNEERVPSVDEVLSACGLRRDATKVAG